MKAFKNLREKHEKTTAEKRALEKEVERLRAVIDKLEAKVAAMETETPATDKKEESKLQEEAQEKDETSDETSRERMESSSSTSKRSPKKDEAHHQVLGEMHEKMQPESVIKMPTSITIDLNGIHNGPKCGNGTLNMRCKTNWGRNKYTGQLVPGGENASCMKNGWMSGEMRASCFHLDLSGVHDGRKCKDGSLDMRVIENKGRNKWTGLLMGNGQRKK